MKLIGLLGAALAALLLSACGKNGGTLNLTLDPPPASSSGGIDNPSSSKPLFSVWTGNGIAMDFRSVRFGVSSSATATLGAQTCSCQVLTQGSEASGTMAISSCSGTDPATCSVINGTANYAKLNSSTLQICLAVGSCYNFN